MSISVNQIRVSIAGTESKGFKIDIAGAPYRLDAFKMHQQLLKPCTLSFELRKDPEEDISEIQFSACSAIIGQEVTLTLQTDVIEKQQTNYSDGGGKTADLEFQGFVASAHAARHDSEYVIQVECLSKDAAMVNHPNCHMYNASTLQSIVSAVAKERNNIEVEGTPQHTDNIFYTVQYKETDCQFLQRLAQRYGEWMFCNGKKLFFGKLDDKVTESLQLKYPSLDIEDYSVSLRTSHQMFGYAVMTYNEMGCANAFLGEDQGDTGNKLNDATFAASKKVYPARTRLFVDGASIEEDSEAEGKNPQPGTHKEQFTAEQHALRSNMLIYQGTTFCSKMRIGTKLTILDNYISGTSTEKSEVQQEEILITDVIHTFGVDDEYRNQFQGITAKISYPPYYNPTVFPHCDHPVRAMVVETDDPKHWGRVKVRFHWQMNEYKEGNPNGNTPWIHVTQQYVGGNDPCFGVHLIPEKFTEVFVDFEDGNFERPYVVGSLFGPQHPVDSGWNPGSNNVKAIRTASGHTIEIHDNESGDSWGKGGFIQIYDNQTHNYDILISTDQKLIKLKSKGNIELYADKDIKLEAGHDIKMKAKHDMTIDVDNDMNTGVNKNSSTTAGENIYIEAGKELWQSSDDNMNISSGKELIVDSEKDMTITSKKKQNVNVKEDQIVKVDKDCKISANNFSAQAKQNVKLKGMNSSYLSDQKAKMQGMQVEVNASASAKIAASASIDINAPIIKES